MDIDTHNDFETNADIPLDAVETHGEMMRAFEAFKEANDERLALGDKRSGDVVLEEMLARLNKTLDAQARGLHDPCVVYQQLRHASEAAAAFGVGAGQLQQAYAALAGPGPRL